MENERIILLVSSFLSLGIFLSRHKFNLYGSKIPEPWFSVVLFFLLISFTALPVSLYNTHFFSENAKSFLKFIPILATVVEIRFRTK